MSSEPPERAGATGSDQPEGAVEEATHSEPPGKSALDEAATVFVGVRRQLFGIAYRMLGSAAEAEDVVQEAWLRWQSTDRTVVLDPPAYLATVTTRLAINVAQSARVRRETYVGPWLPEPVDTSADPQVGAERGEAVELAVLLVLEKLTPTERAAYVLREAFDYPYEQIAAILETGQANARQLVSRARRRLAAERHEPVDAGEHRRLLEAFLAAARTGDLAALEELLAEDVVSYSDGGEYVARRGSRCSAVPASPSTWRPSRRGSGPAPRSSGPRRTAARRCSSPTRAEPSLCSPSTPPCGASSGSYG